MKMLYPVALCFASFIAIHVSTQNSAAQSGPAPNAESANVSSNDPDSVNVFDAELNRLRTVSASEAAKMITDYWTPERRAAATPAYTNVVSGATGASSPEDAAIGPTKLIAEPMPPQQSEISPEAVVNFASAEGKVFFVDPVDGRNYVCSGGTVSSGKKRLVFTAGHCVHGGKGKQWMANWVFEPGFQNGNPGSRGLFASSQLWAKTGWMNNSDEHYDYGIAITNNNAGGQHVVDAVGGNGLQVNAGRIAVTAIGYPDNISGGNIQRFCQATTERRSLTNSDQKFKCDKKHGASGSPVLRDYNNSNQLGLIVSNIAYGLDDDPAFDFGPYLDDDTTSLYRAAEAASPN
jgi:V8-like Glu-specific endopeptidase